MKKLLFTMFLAPCLAFASGSGSTGEKFQITVKNLTKGQVLTMPLAVVHAASQRLFKLDEEASRGLGILAEDGATGPLVGELASRGSRRIEFYKVSATNVMPGKSVSFIVKAKNPRRARFSLVSMLATTNDTFVAANAVKFPKEGSETIVLGNYDAGTEFNSESCATVPGPPCGSHDARDTENAEGKVTKSEGLTGNGDIDVEKYGFSDKAAEVTIEKLVE